MRRRNQLSRDRLRAIIVASCPMSMWVHWGRGNPGFRKALMRGA